MKHIAVFLLLGVLVFPLFAQETHVLQKGETLYRLSLKYGIPVADILDYNNINDPSNVRVGTQIRIPGENSNSELLDYTVVHGDTLYSLARKSSVSIDELRTLNNLKSDSLMAGQTLKLPGRDNPSIPANSTVISLSSDSNIPEKTVLTSNLKDSGKNSSKNRTSESTPYFWPHEGQRCELDGKFSGVQIDGSEGDEIISVSSGKVVWAAPYRGYGKLIIVESKSRHYYVYGGSSKEHVELGETVVPGTKLGKLGVNAHLGQPKVFFAVYKNGKALDVSSAPREH